MTTRVEFFYDYVSIYSYLADSQLANLTGADVGYRPMFLGAVMQATGNRPPGSIETKRQYLRTDATRWARRYGIPLNMNPLFPQNTLKALRLALVAKKHDVFATVHRALFDAMWVTAKDLGSNDVLAQIAQDAGIALEETEHQAIKDELRANTDEALERGVFGAPTFFVGDEMFFGNDRLDFVWEVLRDRA